MSFQIETLKEHNSGLVKLLTQNLPDMLWVKDREGTYIYVNQSLCHGLLMAKSTEEVIKNNKSMKLEGYGNVKGKMLYLEVLELDEI